MIFTSIAYKTRDLWMCEHTKINMSSRNDITCDNPDHVSILHDYYTAIIVVNA